MSSHPIHESIREINANTWIIGDLILLSREVASSTSSWGDGHGEFFTISQLSFPLPQSRPISNQGDIHLVYHVGNSSAVWRIGEAYCKVKAIECAQATREHTTLGFMKGKRTRTFEVPSVIYHGEKNGRYFIIQSRMEGETIAEAWWSMDESMRYHCVSRIVDACKQMAAWEGDRICGVDGNYLSEERLAGGGGVDMSPEALLKNCLEVGMDCSTFNFYHCDMGPGNVIFNRTDGSLAIIDWETAGYVPKEWIRTKFRVSMGLNLPDRDDDSKNDWRRMIQQRLEKEGFHDVADAWMRWSTSRAKAAEKRGLVTE